MRDEIRTDVRAAGRYVPPPSLLNEYLRSMVTVRIRRRVKERICTRSEWRLLRRYERGGDEKVLLALDYVNIMAETRQAWRRSARMLGLIG